jgi:hypothetical protein
MSGFGGYPAAPFLSDIKRDSDLSPSVQPHHGNAADHQNYKFFGLHAVIHITKRSNEQSIPRELENTAQGRGNAFPCQIYKVKFHAFFLGIIFLINGKVKIILS